MIDRLQLGTVPDKPHTVFRDPSGKLYFEHCFTRQGFDGAYTIAYHRTGPMMDESLSPTERGWKPAQAQPASIHRRLFDGNKLLEAQKPADARSIVLTNSDIDIALLRPQSDDDAFVSNNDGDELFYLHSGNATLQTSFGDLQIGPGDYVWVPRSLPYRFVQVTGPAMWLALEIKKGLKLPAQYSTPSGQLKMDAPYSHRDFRRPTTITEQAGPHEVLVKRRGAFYLRRVPQGVLDVVGFDGFVYPVAFNIERFQPKTGQVHLPPPVHATFVAQGLVVCSFVPRVTDTHPEAIPCPYPHSSVDCDEFIFYCRGNFTSRRGVGPAAMSLHPAGVPHGPHPGAYEASIGTTKTSEMAVMVDTYEPMYPTTAASECETLGYHETWNATPTGK